MKVNCTLFVVIVVAIVALSSVAIADSQSITVTRNLTSMPLAFTENQGQWDEQVSFRANAGGAIMWFTSDGAVYQFTRRIPVDQDLGAPQLAVGLDRFDREPDSIESMTIRASFVGANLDPSIKVT